MLYRKLEKPGLKISRIGFGGAAISDGRGYGYGAMSAREAVRLLHAAVGAGINLFDTAPIYGHGTSEQRIGRALKRRRDRVVLLSKAGVGWAKSNRSFVDNSYFGVLRSLERSLRNLGTDYIDIYLLHRADLLKTERDFSEAMEALAHAKAQGKVRAIGLSNCSRESLVRASPFARIDVLENELSLFANRSLKPIQPLLTKRKVGLVTYGAFDKGLLAGTYKPGRRLRVGDVRANFRAWSAANRQWKAEAVRKLEALAGDLGHSMPELSLGYVLSNREVTSALVGPRNLSQLQAVLKALEHLPGKAALAEALEIVGRARAGHDEE